MPDRTGNDDALLALAFSINASPGAYALLVGAGVSAPSGIPTAWGVLRDLALQVAHLRNENPPDSVAWYESTFGEPARYETLLERLAPTQIERQRLLQGYFEPSPAEQEAGEKGPTEAHRAIARMVKNGTVRIILTLNFDRLIEQAVRAEGVEPTVVSSPGEIDGMAPLHTLSCCIIHLHGDYLNPRSMLNTLTELQDYHPSTGALLAQILKDYGLVIAGWSSIYDPALRAAVDANYPSRLTLAWIEPNEPSTEATELRIRKNGLLMQANADDGLGALADAVDALNARAARHPLTLPVAIETAKRELSGRHTAIALHDTIQREFATLHDHSDFHLPDHQTDQPYGGYSAMTARVEEKVRVCSGLVATVARWGNDTTDQWWIDEIERFAVRARANGLTNLLTLRLVAGSSLFYAAGTASVAGRRWSLLARLLRLKRQDPYSAQLEPLGITLDPDWTYGTANGAQQLRVALQPVLCEALACDDSSLDLAWEQFEVLRLAQSLLEHERFAARFEELRIASSGLRDAQAAVENVERLGGDTTDVRYTLAAAVRAEGRAVGGLADLVRMGRPHLLVTDHRGDGYRNPLAERLVHDLQSELQKHILATSGYASDPARLAAAVGAVSVAAGRIGSTIAYSRVPRGGGAVPSEVWLDSGKTPDEIGIERRSCQPTLR